MSGSNIWLKAAILLVVAAGQGLLGLTVAAQPVSDSLLRQAMTARQPERVVLLSMALAGKRMVAVGERGIVIISDDRGRSWRQVPAPVSVSLTMVRFADEQHGVAVGHRGVVLSTSDGGQTWQQRLDGVRAAELILKSAQTEREREDAQRLLNEGADKPFLDVLMWSEDRLLVVGAYGLALYSEDGGRRWTSWMSRIPNQGGLHWYVVRRQGENLLLAGEQGQIVRSSDGGQHFESLKTPYRGSWFAGEYASDGSLVLGGLRGNLWRSTDRGNNWGHLPTPTPASLIASTVLADDSIAFVNQAGHVLRVRAATLESERLPAIPMAATVLAVDRALLAIAGATGVTMFKIPTDRGANRP